MDNEEEEVNDEPEESNATSTELIKQVKTTVRRENPKLNSQGNFKDNEEEEEEVNDEAKESNAAATTVKLKNTKLKSQGKLKDNKEEEVNDEPTKFSKRTTEFLRQRKTNVKPEDPKRKSM